MGFRQFLMFTLSSVCAFATTAKAGECDLQSSTFDASTFAIEPKSYKSDLQSCRLLNSSGDLSVVSLRSFEVSKKAYSLIVDQDRMVTGIVPRSCLQSCTEFTAGGSSPYAAALTRTTSGPIPLQDGGVIHATTPDIQMFVTADLCPSEKPLVREVFERMITLATSAAVSPAQSLVASVAPEFSRPAVAVALSVSGEWMRKHESDLDYLKSQEHAGNLQITWVNHTFTHPYDPELPLAHNFILKTGVNFPQEILENEKLMLKNGLVPSIFVRFPGLISDQEHMTELRGWGLIPLGADAWIAKGQSPHNGSIILIHANGNEPKGIRMFEDLLTQHTWWVRIFQNLPRILETHAP